jgi:hypothetical protein
VKTATRRSISFRLYLSRWMSTTVHPRTLEHYQAHVAELHDRILQAICDGPYSMELTVETFPIVGDFCLLGWKQCENWRTHILRWMYDIQKGIPTQDRRMLEAEEVLL